MKAQTTIKLELVPTSRRFIRDEWHPYGRKISFWQSVRWPSGRITRHHFSDIGVDRKSAIGNALRYLSLLATIGEERAAEITSKAYLA